MVPALRAAALLSLLALPPAASSVDQGACTTGCEVAFHLGITQDASYGANGESVQVTATSLAGDCIPTLNDGVVICVSSGCDTEVQYDVLGMDPGEEVWECHAKSLPVQRTDCRTPPPLTDATGGSSSISSPLLGCGSGEHTFQVSCAGLTAQVRITCEACDP